MIIKFPVKSDLDSKANNIVCFLDFLCLNYKISILRVIQRKVDFSITNQSFERYLIKILESNDEEERSDKIVHKKRRY